MQQASLPSVLAEHQRQPQAENKKLEVGATREGALENLKSCRSILDTFGGVLRLIQPILKNPQDPHSVDPNTLVFKFLGVVNSRKGNRQIFIKPEWKALIDAARKEYDVSLPLLAQLGDRLNSDQYNHLSATNQKAIAGLLGQMNKDLEDVTSTIKRLENLEPAATQVLDADEMFEAFRFNTFPYNYNREPVFIQFVLDYLHNRHFFLQGWDKLTYTFKRPLMTDIGIINSAASQALALFPKK